MTKKDILEFFKKLNIKNKNVVVHASYKSLGPVLGGPQTVIDALLESFDLVMVPATSYRSVTKHPEGDTPERNGCDYHFYHNWNREVLHFNLEQNSIDKKMGIIAQLMTQMPSSHRSNTPWHSWTANGKNSQEITDNSDWSNTDKPLKKLIERDGVCLMLGVDLSTCSAIHIAEELAGRNHFIRWCADSEGHSKRVEAQSCGEGFNNLLPYCDHLIRKEKLGNATVMIFKLKEMIDEATALIKKNPNITKCSEQCIKCRDSALGGPILLNGENRAR